jgi:hypothetical protein
MHMWFSRKLLFLLKIHKSNGCAEKRDNEDFFFKYLPGNHLMYAK